MAALDLLGRRWTLRILWELREEPLGFRALQQRCDAMSSSVLRDRLGELRSAAIVGTDQSGAYRLTPLGHELGAALGPLSSWSERWAGQLGVPPPTGSDR
jgi:DNA-binding HxlR family transcriptional regulator